jgi:hypothetical protein
MSMVSFAGLESTCFSWDLIGKNDSWLCPGLMDLFDIYGWSYQLIKTIWTLVDVYVRGNCAIPAIVQLPRELCNCLGNCAIP